MASMWRKAMLYLGLGPDEEYDDFDVTGEHQRAVQPRPVVRRTPGDVQHDPEPSGSVRTLSPSDDHDAHDSGRNGHDHSSDHRHENGRSGAARTPDRSADRGVDPARGPARRATATAGDRPGRERGAVVRPLPSAAGSKPFVVGPSSFNDAQEVADKFKINVPVILNLQGVERDLARRIIDFASGLCYGLGGQMERVANQVYLLTPSDVEVSPEERRRLRERGYEA
jgi:cell division inhibitor SepF